MEVIGIATTLIMFIHCSSDYLPLLVLHIHTHIYFSHLGEVNHDTSMTPLSHWPKKSPTPANIWLLSSVWMWRIGMQSRIKRLWRLAPDGPDTNTTPGWTRCFTPLVRHRATTCVEVKAAGLLISFYPNLSGSGLNIVQASPSLKGRQK